MPDRFQNINIVYKVNTVDVENATIQVAKAKAATDALTNSAKNLGDQGSKNTQQFTNTIEGVRLAMQQLKAQIDLTSQSDKARLDGLSAQYRELQGLLDKYNANINLTTANTQKATIGLGDMYSAVKLLLTAGLAKEIASAAVSMATLSGRLEGIKAAFDKLPNSQLLMGQLKEATKGVVDQFTLMQKALQAQNFGIPLEKLGMLLEFATTRAQQTGISVDYLVNSIVTGLGRNSVKILDNLQINIAELKKRMTETGQTMQVVAIQMIGESMKKMDGYIVTSETSVNRLNTAFRELKQTLSQGWVGATAGWFVTVMADIVKDFAGGFGAESGAINGAIQRVNDFRKANEALLKTEQGVVTVERELDKLKKELLISGGDANKAVSDLRNRNYSSNAEAERIRIQGEQARLRNIEIAKEIELFQQLEKQMRIAGTAKVGEAGILKTLNDKLTDLNEQLTNATSVERQEQIKEQIKEQERLIDIYGKYHDKAKERLDLDLENAKQWKDVIIKYYDEVVKKMEDAFKNTPHGLPKGSQPAGGFMGPMGAPNTTTRDSDQVFKDWYNQYATFWDKLEQGFKDLGGRIHKGTEETVEDQRRQWQRAVGQIGQIFSKTITDTIQSIDQAEINSIDQKIKATQDFYTAQIQAAGDNSAAKIQLQKREDEALKRLAEQKAQVQKRQAEESIAINAAVGIIRAFAEYDWEEALIISAAIAAAAIVQVDNIERASSGPGYAEGVIDLKGPGTEKSDSISARLSRGESVMTAEETRNSMGILKAIRARKLDDDIINSIIAKSGGSQQVFSDRGIIEAIKSQPRVPNLVRHGSIVFEALETKKNSIKYVRSKYLSS